MSPEGLPGPAVTDDTLEVLRRRAEAAEGRARDAEAQQARLLNFLHSSSDWFWETDAQHRFSFVSARSGGSTRRLEEDTTDPHLGLTRLDAALRVPGDEALWQRHEADLAAHRPFRDLTYRSKLAPRPYWLRVSGRPVFEEGRFQGYRGVGRDVTAEILSEEGRLAQERLMGAVIDGLPVGVCLFDAEGRLVLTNRAYAELSGLPFGTFRAGMTRADVIRILALRGVYGPGDVEQQVAEQLALDAKRPARRLRRSPDGRTVEVRIRPLAQGMHLLVLSDVTALVTAEEQARLRAERLDDVLGTLRSGVAVFGGDRTIQYASPRLEELLGLAPGTVRSGMTLGVILETMQDRGELSTLDAEAYVAERLSADPTRPSLLRRLRPNGMVVEIASDPVQGGGFITVVSDVTALARAEDEARRRAEALAAVLEHVPHGISVYGPDRRVALVNRAYNRIMAGAEIGVGDHREDIIRTRALAGEYGVGNAEAMIVTERTLEMTRPHSRRRRRPNGTAIDIRTAPMPDGGYVCVVTDITATVEAEAASGRRASQLDSMMASIRHGICLFDRAARLVARNPIALELLGLEAGQVEVGMGYDAFLRRALDAGLFGSGPPAFERLRALVEEDRGTPWRRSLRMRDGRVLDIRFDPTGDQGFVVTYTDVTEQDEAQAVLSRAKEAAEAASRAKSQFLASMSHELRTPLNAVIGFSETMQHEAANRPDLAQFHEFASAIHDAGRHLLAVINDILDGARIESGRLDMIEAKVDLGALCASTLRLVEPVARAARVRLRVDAPEALPMVVADERRLRQVLLNLLSNAVKFTPGGGTVELVAATLPDGSVELRVTDSGIGIHETDIDRVFQPFTQLDNGLSRRFQGSGLGLFLSRALATAHGGSLNLESSPGLGTTAILRLPASRVLPSPTTEGAPP